LGLSAISSSLAAEPLYTTTSNQTASPGTSWTGASYWKLNGAGTGVAPTAGNTYEVQFNGTTYGNGMTTAVIRPPYSAGTPNVVTFPGDCLILDTNTCLRFKEVTTPTAGTNGLGYASPTNNFPGANGLPGLVLNGGILNGGTTPSCYTIQGTMQAAPGTLSYLNPADTLNGSLAKRGFVIASQLSGSGSLAWINATSAVPQVVSGTSNTFAGTWIVKSGWVVGNGDGTSDGYNSLGTNTAVVFDIDPQWTPPPIFNANSVWTPGPAVLDLGSANANCGGTLILTNGGRLNLHSTVAFGSVIVEGTNLANGVYLYSQLTNSFPNNFPAGGSGGIVVRPYTPAPPFLPPTIVTQPLPQKVFAGVTATFSVNATANGAPSMTYQWQRAGANLVDGGNISGSTNATLIVSNVSAADAVNYDVVVANTSGSVTSGVVPLTIVTPSGEPYEAAVLAAHPAAYYRLNETGDPATNNSPAFDNVSGFVGTYGSAVKNGNSLYNVAGPSALNGFSGFSAGNAAAQFFGSQGSRISLPPWNINTNTMTFTAWINPSTVEGNGIALLFVRNGTGAAVAGLAYNGNMDASGNHTLSYNWNDEPNTFNWNSGLTTPPGQWSFVALVVTPTNATMYVINASGALASVHTYNHISKAFTVAGQIGEDSFDGGNGNRSFNGVIDDVAVFGSALSPSQVLGLYSAASGGTTFGPAIAVQPASTNLYQGQTAQFTALAAGNLPLSYQWQAGATGSGFYTNITDGGQFSGATTPTLTITGLDMPNAADYIVVVNNAYGTVSSTVATLMVQATNPPGPGNITMGAQEGNGADWNTVGVWSDGNAASFSAVAYPGSVYEVLPGARLRSPAGPDVTYTFPGNTLLLDGDGIWVNSPGAGATIGELRFKQPTYGTANGVVNFPRLVMNGGQLDTGNDGTVIVGGEIDVVTNAPFYNDGGNDRGYLINALLTGNASIEYHGYNQSAFMPAYTNCLNIACPTNTYSGTWNVVIGTLLGSAPNSLGTNSITVGTNGALETTYDIHSPKATLILNGRMFLHQNDVFGSVVVAGTALDPGTYTQAQLAALYPTNFPATWTPKFGAGNFSTGSGSITVLGMVAPTITIQPLASQMLFAQQTARFTATVIGSQPLYYQWMGGAIGSGVYTNMHNGGVYAGANSANFIISPVDLPNAGDYILVVTNLVGATTSTVATLTVQPVYGPAEQITMSGQEPLGADWDTGSYWSDGNAASNSAVWYPGSTYELLPGSRLRTPAGNATTYTFPGLVLTNDGIGIFNNATNGEFRFKQAASGGAVVVPRLVMNGGQVDLGNPGLVILKGQVDVVSNAIFFADIGGNAGRSLQLDSFITGSANIEWHSFDASLADDLNVTCPTNTYTGTWNAVQGVLLGSGTNSLGTNNITVGANGALETTYDIYAPKAALTLNGKLFLHQHDTFRTLFCNG
jgi:hypothetical protein